MNLNLKSLKKAVMDLIAFVPLLITAILSIFDYFLKPQLTKNKRWAFIILIIVSLVFAGISLQQQQVKDMESSSTGTISSNLKSITYPCITLGKTLEIGGGREGFVPMKLGNGFSLGSPRISGESNPVQNEEDKIIVWIENGQLKVSAVIRDKDGKILARMVGNNFFTMPRPAILDRNYDDNDLEVEDAYGNIALQVSMVGPCARILGIFYDKSGNCFVVNDTGFYLGSNPRLYSVKINPIFVHPCEGHLGERINKD